MAERSFVEQVQEFFFNAMVEGWAGNASKFTIPQMPGYKAISFQYGDFRLLDCYCVNPHSRKSAGTTTIWHKGLPVWVMNYGGYYEKHVIDFLKEVLLKTYKKKYFFGGRGSPRVSNAKVSLLYTNDVFHSIDFSNYEVTAFSRFHGTERITDLNEEYLYGYHDYQGMILV